MRNSRTAQNMPLVSEPVQVLPAAFVPLVPGSIATTADPGHGTPGALGDTWHGLINAINILPRTPLFDTATFAAELTWMQWAKVTQNEAVFKGRSSTYTGDRQACRRNFFGLAINFTPTWFQVWPGVDLFAPLYVEPGPVGQRGRRVRRQQERRQLERRHRGRHLSEVPHRSQVQRLLRRLLDRHRRRPARVMASPTARSRRSPIAAGYRSLSRPHSDGGTRSCFAGLCWPRAFAATRQQRRIGRRCRADEAKQLGTTLTPVGAEKAGNKDGTIPEYTGG